MRKLIFVVVLGVLAGCGRKQDDSLWSQRSGSGGGVRSGFSGSGSPRALKPTASDTTTPTKSTRSRLTVERTVRVSEKVTISVEDYSPSGTTGK